MLLLFLLSSSFAVVLPSLMSARCDCCHHWFPGCCAAFIVVIVGLMSPPSQPVLLVLLLQPLFSQTPLSFSRAPSLLPLLPLLRPFFFFFLLICFKQPSPPTALTAQFFFAVASNWVVATATNRAVAFTWRGKRRPFSSKPHSTDALAITAVLLQLLKTPSRCLLFRSSSTAAPLKAVPSSRSRMDHLRWSTRR